MTPPFPSTPILDNFNRADTGPPPSASWDTTVSGNLLDVRYAGAPGLAVRSNAAKALADGEASMRWSAVLSSSDNEAYCTLNQIAYSVELWARHEGRSAVNTGSPWGYLVFWSGGSQNLRIQKYGPGGVAGYADLTATAAIPGGAVSGMKLGIRCQGTSITAWYMKPGGSWTQILSATDSTFTSGPQLGVLVYQQFMILDDFGGGRIAVEQAAAGTVTPAGALTIGRTSNAVAAGGALAPTSVLSRSLARALGGTLLTNGGLSTSVTHVGGGAAMTNAGVVGLQGDLLVEQIIPPPVPVPEPIPPTPIYAPWTDCETVQFRNAEGDAVTFLMLSGATGRMMPPVKITSLPVPVANGSRLVGTAHLERPVVIPVAFPGSITDRAELRRWARVLDPNKGEGVLTVVQGPNAGRRLTCVYEAGLDDLAEDHGHVNSGRLVFRASWPYWEDGIEQTVSAAQGAVVAEWFPFFPLVLSPSDAFVEFTVQIDGDVESWPVVDVRGPSSLTVATNLTTGKSWTVSGLVPSGQTLRVDTRPGHKQVLQNGVNAFDRLVLPSSLWPLVPGGNRVQLSAALTDVNSLVGMTWRNQWLSA